MNKKCVLLCIGIFIIVIIMFVIFNTNYLTKNNIKVNSINNFSVSGLLFEWDEINNKANYNKSNKTSVDYVINSISKENSSRDNYITYIIDYSASIKEYFKVNEDGSNDNMTYAVINGPILFDSYSGQSIYVDSSSKDNSTLLSYHMKNYKIYITKQSFWKDLPFEYVDDFFSYYPQEYHEIIKVDIPSKYDGLLFGFNSLKDYNIKSKHNDNYYINDFVDDSSKLFKVEEYVKEI